MELLLNCMGESQCISAMDGIFIYSHRMFLCFSLVYKTMPTFSSLHPDPGMLKAAEWTSHEVSATTKDVQ